MQNETIPETQNLPRKQTKRNSFVTLLNVSLVLLLIAVISLVVFPAPILRIVFSRIEAQSGITLTFERAYFYISDGSFLHIGGLTIQRQDHHAGNFILKAESVQMPAMVPSDFRSPVLYITGLRGIYERVGNDTKSSGGSHIQGVMLKNAEVDFIDRTPENPFQVTVQINDLSLATTRHPSLFESYYIDFVSGRVDSAALVGGVEEDRRVFALTEVPLGIFAPYAPVLDDIFVAGSMNIMIEDFTDETQKKLRIDITLLPDCEIKSADEIFAPAIQTALQTLDQSSIPALHNLEGKIERVKTVTESLRVEADRFVQVIDTFRFLAPRDVQEKYDNIKNQYDRARATYENWQSLQHDIDQVKVRIVEETFRHFVKTGTPIEIELQEVNGEWQYDAYDTVIRLIERRYRAVIAAEYGQRIQEILNAADKLTLYHEN